MMSYSANLVSHPTTVSRAVQGIEVRVHWTRDGALALRYVLRGDIMRVRIPSARPPRRTDRLWEHTCFEAFISVKGRSAYREFNFSPSGEWAAYAFPSYRQTAPLENNTFQPDITVHMGGGSLTLDVNVSQHLLPEILRQALLRLGLCAVIEEEPRRLTYWALRHPPGKPDFHHAHGFMLELEPPARSAGERHGNRR
jgi:hypothetical protein